jgi:hypothetical protein
MQAGTAVELCTSCEGCRASVEDGGKRRKAALLGPIRDGGLQNRLPARIFTVDIRHRGRRIPAVRFPNSALATLLPRSGLGMKETCEEKL